ncbi:type II secretion system F family protein [Frigoribacterium faeni]|uniref:type II secretion system F family protein n=1 Tax=Frigoribacterium TaxID=96492 RepID=UPI00177F7ABF|nr:type II secretion system F family protein [Frigoribacterium faeni]MBD8702547.1 type II secretion system F family protein [Frigoribacterium sp. CFBP 13712]MCJ0699825.1 type II secretion system F family protein [Frigoribacterium faeni]
MPPERRRRLVTVTPASTVVERVAVLLSAGVVPASAWRHVAESEPPGPVREVTFAVATEAVTGMPISEALAAVLGGRPFARAPDGPRHELDWRQVACAWFVAERSGAPLADCLRTFVAGLRAAEAARRDVEVALSGPRSTGRIVLALPPVGLLFSMGMGFDTAGVLVGTPVGWGCLAVGAGLVALARAWNARLVRGATPEGPVPGLRLELLAVAVSGGASWDSGLALVRSALELLPSADADGSGVAVEDDAERDCLEVLDLSRRAGAPAGELLRATARERRLRSAADSQSAAARLGSTLMLPLGLCVLPAFLVVAVVPLVVSLVSSTTASW